jgi:hypothetical protein
MSRVAVSRKTECKVCKDTGKSRHVYESHFPGKCCPTLLESSCTRCGKKGHTKKYCKVNLEARDAQIKKVFEKASPKPSEVAEKQASKKSFGGAFAALEESESDSDSEKLSPNVTVREKPKSARFMNWADYESDDE